MAERGLARRVGCSDGQLWTLAIVATLAVVLVPATFPAGLRPRGDVLLALPAVGPAPGGTPVPAGTVLAAPTAVALAAPARLLPAGLPLLARTDGPGPAGPGSAGPGPAAPRRPPGGPPSAAVVLALPPGGPAGRQDPATTPQIVQAGWFDAAADATVRGQLTPAGELPVSAQAGTAAATVLLRLRGAGPTLTLAVDANPARTNGAAALQLCRNRSANWTGYDAMPPAAAPPVQDHQCAAGAQDGAVWRFPLGALGPADADSGFTLRATGGTFALTLTRENPS